MSLNRVLAAMLLIGATGAAGCHSASSALGMSKVTPDEFRVVTKAPLVLPPDYSLRPPAPGEPRPQELQPESAAEAALLGQRQAEVRSPGEKMLVTKAGADHADPLVRYVVDDEFGDIAHKDKSYSNWVIHWHKGDPPTQAMLAQGADTATPVDPATEAARISNLTANRPIIISHQTSTQTKLPGL